MQTRFASLATKRACFFRGKRPILAGDKEQGRAVSLAPCPESVDRIAPSESIASASGYRSGAMRKEDSFLTARLL